VTRLNVHLCSSSRRSSCQDPASAQGRSTSYQQLIAKWSFSPGFLPSLVNDYGDDYGVRFGDVSLVIRNRQRNRQPISRFHSFQKPWTVPSVDVECSILLRSGNFEGQVVGRLNNANPISSFMSRSLRADVFKRLGSVPRLRTELSRRFATGRQTTALSSWTTWVKDSRLTPLLQGFCLRSLNVGVP